MLREGTVESLAGVNPCAGLLARPTAGRPGRSVVEVLGRVDPGRLPALQEQVDAALNVLCSTRDDSSARQAAVAALKGRKR